MRLLLVDDNDQLRAAVRRRLEREGLSVVCEACDGLEALQILDSQPVDAVVLDVQMPRMDGITAVQRIRKEHPEVAVVAFSADPRTEAPMRAGGAIGFVLKNHTDELLEVLRSIDRGGRSDLDADFSTYLELAEILWRTPPSVIAAAARVTGGPIETQLITDVLGLKMEARERAGSQGEQAAVAKLAIRLGRLPDTEVDALLGLLTARPARI